MTILQKLIIEPFDKCCEKLLYFLPNLLTSIFLLILGVVLAIVLKIVFLKIFKTINLDKFSERFGVLEMLSKSGVKEPMSILISKIIKWVTIFTFVVISMQNLKIPTVEHLFERFFLYLPNIFVAAFILLLGYLLSNFFGRAALIASVNAGIRSSGLIGKLVKFTVFVISATMALEQLGIGRDTVVIAFAIIYGGIVLAFAIACGLGGKDIAREFLEKKMKEEEKKDEINHL